jgi:Host cell surface-exposed lipoprotein
MPAGHPRGGAERAFEMTVSQANALQSAERYLSMSAFSRSGLIQQLSSRYGEGYPKTDAIFAVDHVSVDWNEQAVRAAQGHLAERSFSREGLIHQLEAAYGDGFTHAEAVYGVNQTGLI